MNAILELTDEARPRAGLIPCREYDPEEWFPPGGENAVDEPAERRRQLEARALCAGCPLTLPCLAAALDSPDRPEWGYWGGTTRAERMAVVRSEQRGRARARRKLVRVAELVSAS